MIEYVLKTVCSWFGYNIIPTVKPRQVHLQCIKNIPKVGEFCECEVCMPW